MAEGGSTVFLVRDYQVTRLNKQAQDFIEKPTPAITPGAAALPPVGGEEDFEEEPLEDLGDE